MHSATYGLNLMCFVWHFSGEYQNQEEPVEEKCMNLYAAGYHTLGGVCHDSSIEDLGT